jgi:hypothetical protein
MRLLFVILLLTGCSNLFAAPQTGAAITEPESVSVTVLNIRGRDATPQLRGFDMIVTAKEPVNLSSLHIVVQAGESQEIITPDMRAFQCLHKGTHYKDGLIQPDDVFLISLNTSQSIIPGTIVHMQINRAKYEFTVPQSITNTPHLYP